MVGLHVTDIRIVIMKYQLCKLLMVSACERKKIVKRIMFIHSNAALSSPPNQGILKELSDFSQQI